MHGSVELSMPLQDNFALIADISSVLRYRSRSYGSAMDLFTQESVAQPKTVMINFLCSWCESVFFWTFKILPRADSPERSDNPELLNIPDISVQCDEIAMQTCIY